MNGILALARAHLITALRERVTLFWFIVFPVFLLVILTLIFGNLGKQGGMNFQVGLVNLEEAEAGPDLARVVISAFAAIGEPEDGKEPLFSLHRPGPGEDKQGFLSHAKEELQHGRLAAVVVIPRGFNQAVLSDAGAEITVYTDPTRSGSALAADVIAEVVSGVNREILVRIGRLDPNNEIPMRNESLAGMPASFSYASFLLPGVVLMAFFTAGLFGVPGAILYARDRFQLRRYWVTPLTVPRYLAGFSLGQLGLSAVQFAVLFAIGEYGLGARVNFARPQAIAFLILGFCTFLAFGFLIAAVAKTANGAMAIANILNIPLMFLGGLFFPVGDLPGFLRAIVLVNPVTYIADGLRAGLGLTQGTTSPIGSVLVPLGWIALSVLVAARRLSWEAER